MKAGKSWWMDTGSLFSQAPTESGTGEGGAFRACPCINICVEASETPSDGLFLGVELFAGG